MHTARGRLLAAATASLITLTGVAASTSPAEAKPKPALVTGHLISFNDFHGNIDPPAGSGGMVNGVPAGGAEYLATAVKDLRAAAEADSDGVLTVAAGDLVGASPLVSAAFHDEPAVEEMNSLGLDITSVGNHEFDEGVNELLRLQNGGCHPVDGCQDGDGFEGADYPMLAANVVYRDSGNPILKPYVVEKIGGVKVGFIGETLEGTPSIVNPAGITNVNFLDEADTANMYADKLSDRGVHAFVLLLHEGGQQSGPNATDINGCNGFSGAVTDIVNRLSPSFGVVISGHTHRSYVCDLPNSGGDTSLVTSAGSFGTLATDVTMTLNSETGTFVSADAENHVAVNGAVVNGVIVRDPSLADPAAKVIADKYRTAVAPISNRIVGTITADITRTVNPAQESALGDVIADGMVAYTQSAGAQIALMNPGGIRSDLVFANSPGGEAPGQVTFGETFAVQPFNNLVVTVDLTGAALKSVLEQQFVGFAGQNSTKFLQISAGFSFSYDTRLALGSRITAMSLGGVPIDPAATYRVTTNDFVANGGDGFTNMSAATNRVTAPGFDVDALAAYLGTGPIAPGPQNRIILVG
jgi:5'-nucleotidase